MVVNGGLGIYNGAALWSKDKKAEGVMEDLAGIQNARIIGKKVAETAILMKKA